ncbi:MAG: LysR family transcriptional regulator [Actinobacteria bacterium]|nr:LysR family transcriptional regulator [Actinomycetota bacterium]
MRPDLNKLANFIAVAEELNFTRAAERQHLSQQALSTSIRQLERELGVALLERTTRQVTLTAAGRSLLERGQPVLAAAESTWERTREIGRGATGTVRVGRTPAVTGEEVAQVLAAGRRRHPDLAIMVDQVWPAELTPKLLRGEIELAMGRVLSGGDGIAVRTIGSQRLRVALSSRHRLAGRGEIDLTELEEETLVVWAQNSGYTQLLLDVCRRAGFEPRRRVNPMQGTPPVTAVSSPDEFAFVTLPAGTTPDAGAVIVDFRPVSTVPLQAMWLENGAPPLTADLAIDI